MFWQMHDQPLFVKSPGYAWGRVNFDLSVGGERTLELVPGGGLTVQLLGDWQRINAEFELAYPPELRIPCCEIEVSFEGRDRLVFDGVQPGKYRAYVRSSDSSDPRKELASAAVEVRAGEETFVDFDAPAPISAEKAPLRGTLVVPHEYDIESLKLSIEPLDLTISVAHGMQLDPARADTWKWSAGDVLPGHYLLRLEPLGCWSAVEVGPSGRTDVEILVPPSGLVSVEVVERETLRPAEVEALEWSGRFGPSNRVEANPPASRIEFRAPQGEIDIGLSSDAFRGHKEDIRVGSGRTEVRLEVARFSRVTLDLRDGETSVRWEGLWTLEAHYLEDETTRPIPSVGISNTHPLFLLERPGRYRFVIPDIPGFAPIPPQDLTVIPGTSIDHVIQLVRNP
jgi:hypothetical protein